MPIVQIDWQKIKSKLGDDTALFALTLRQASMLLGLSEQLTWEKTFRVDDYDWADKDILDADIADLQRNLAMPTNLVDIIQYIDEIEGLLRGIQSITNCCDGDDITGGDQYTDPVVDGVGDVPQNIIDAGYATDAADWTGFADYKCMISHIMVDQMELRLRKLHSLVDDTGDILGGVAVAATIITTVFTTIITGGISVMALGIIASTGVAAVLWKAITDATDLNILADAVDENHDALACAINAGDGSEDSVNLLVSKIDELFTGSSAIILKNLNLEPTLKALYSGGYDQQNIAQLIDDHGYDTTAFDCTCSGTTADAIVLYDMNPWIGQWNKSNGTASNFEQSILHTQSSHPQTCYVGKSGGQINVDFSLGWTTKYLRRIDFKYMFWDIAPTVNHASTNYVRLNVQAEGGGANQIWKVNWNGTSVASNIWYSATLEGAALGYLENQIMDENNIALYFACYIANTHTGSIGFRWTDIKLYLDQAS